MAVTAATLTAPAGELEPAVLFPADDSAAFAARCAAWIAEGTERADGLAAGLLDEAITLWCYARAYDAVALRLMAEPATQRLDDQGSTSYTTAQLAAIQGLAAARHAAFDALVASDVEAEAPPPGRVPSESAAAAVTW